MDCTSIRNAAGERLDATWHEAQGSPMTGQENKPYVVVIGHGVTANQDREWAVCLAETLAAAGFHALRFSFSGNGASEGRFEDSCPSKEVLDLGAVLDTLQGFAVIYVGHSMGAAVGVLRTAQDSRIQKLVSLGGMVDTADFAERKFGSLTPGQDFMWDKPECPLSQSFLDDMRAIASVESQAQEIQVPWLLVHGSEDSVVPLAESERMSKIVEPAPELQVLDGGDHVFSGEYARDMAARVLSWLQA